MVINISEIILLSIILVNDIVYQETNQIKRIPFAVKPVEGAGADGAEFEMIFPENYYQLHEIFKIEKTGQQCMVVSPSVRKSDRMFSVMCRLIDDDYSSVLDTTGCEVGDLTHFIGNAKPELHDCGSNASNNILNCWKFIMNISSYLL